MQTTQAAGRVRTLRPPALRAILAVPPVAVLLLGFAWPVLQVLSSQSADAWRWASSPYVRDVLRIAVQQALLSTVLALAAALPLAWLHHRRDLPNAWLAVHATPFVLPVFVVVFGLQASLGPVLAAVGPWGAVAIANAYYNYGVLAQLLHATLQRRPRDTEAAARTLGASPAQAFWRTSAPLLLPSAASAVLLAFLFSFSSFGVALYLGQGKVVTLETALYSELGGAFSRTDRAAVLGTLQIFVNMLLLGGFLALQRQRWPGNPPERAPARAWRIGAPLLALLPLVPLATLLASAFRVHGSWSLEAWRALTQPNHPAHLLGFGLGHALLVSLGYATAGTLCALALTLLLWQAFRPRALAEALASLPLGTSSLVLGLGLAVGYGAASPLADLRGTYAVVLLAHTLLAWPFVARALLPVLAGLDPRWSESAAALGAGPWHRLARVELPLARATLWVALATAAALSLGELGAGLLLTTPETAGLTVWIARHGGAASFDPLRRSEALALAALLLALTGVLYGLGAWAATRAPKPMAMPRVNRLGVGHGGGRGSA